MEFFREKGNFCLHLILLYVVIYFGSYMLPPLRDTLVITKLRNKWLPHSIGQDGGKNIKQWVRECDICQHVRNENVPLQGLLQPLPIPEKVWRDISLDFIEGLPLSSSKSVIFVVVDLLSKYGHFLPLSQPYTAQTVAKVFFENIFKLHGMPASIVSYHDPVFTSRFWTELFKLQGVTLKMSFSYHPQSVRQPDVLNRCLENYLSCYASDHPKSWTRWIPLAE